MSNLIVPAAIGLYLIWLLLIAKTSKRATTIPQASNLPATILRRWMPRAIILTAWLFGLIPNLLSVMERGRSAVLVTTVEGHTQAAADILQVLFLLFATLCAVTIFLNLHRFNSVPFGRLSIALFPFFALLIAHLMNDGEIRPDTFMYPLGICALFLAGFQLKSMSIVGWATIWTAILSLYLAFQFPDIGTTPPPIVGDKAYWPTLLAGPYSHPNVLGLALSLGMPFVLLIRSRFVQVVGLLVAGTGLLWSGNRNSIAAAVLGITVLLVLRAKPRLTRWGVLLAFAGGALVALLPFITDDPAAYSYRGRIWTASLEQWKSSAVFGAGPEYYQWAAGFVNDLGLTAFSGHNGVVHALVTGGLVLLAATTLFVGKSMSVARKQNMEAASVAFGFILIFVFGSALQNSITFINLTELAYVSWLPMAAILFAPRHTFGPDKIAGVKSGAHVPAFPMRPRPLR